jgi:hypothetical protein
MTLVVYRLSLILTTKLSLSFADESQGAAGWLPPHRRDGGRRQKRADRRFVALSEGFCQDFSLCRAQWWRINNKAVVLHTNPRDEGAHPLRLRNCNSLVNALDAAPTSPREELLSDDERGTPEPTRTDAFVSEKSVSDFAAW